MFRALFSHSVVVFITGLAINALIILGLALTQFSAQPVVDLHLWAHTLLYAELGALGGYIIKHVTSELLD